MLFLLLLCGPSLLAANEIGGKKMVESLDLAGHRLVLNGAGLRTKFFFKIYAGGLYLETPSRDATAIITADAPMLVRMHFIYDGVSAEKLREAWNEGFALTAPDAAARPQLRAAITTFVDLFQSEAREDDVYDISWLPEQGVRVSRNGREQGLVPGLAFKKALFAIWLGPRPVDEDLKEGMLGR